MFCHSTRLSFFACQKDAAGAGQQKKSAPAPTKKWRLRLRNTAFKRLHDTDGDGYRKIIRYPTFYSYYTVKLYNNKFRAKSRSRDGFQKPGSGAVEKGPSSDIYATLFLGIK